MSIILVTGAAGFIGMHLSGKLLADGHSVIGLDNLNDYYDVNLKQKRLEYLKKSSGFLFYNVDITDQESLFSIVREHAPTQIVNLAAQAGVRYSIENPHAYIQSNIVGFLNILEACRHFNIEHLLYASSSSVYGGNTKIPFSTTDSVDTPISLYAATKRADELMAYCYSHLYNIKATGLRFFTVYGPWGRPDMACFLFTKSIFEGSPIKVFNNGDMWRDFTFVDDIVVGIIALIKNSRALRLTPHHYVYNIGNNSPIKLTDFIGYIEKEIGQEAVKTFLPLQDGDVLTTFADIDPLIEDTNFRPTTSVQDGVRLFVEWYREFYGERKI